MIFIYPYLLLMIAPITGLYLYLVKYKNIVQDKKSKKSILLLFLALLLIVVVISRPVIKKEDQSVIEKTYNLLIALDVSKSMFAEDISPNRYLYSLSTIEKLLSKAIDFRVGLVVFSDSSHMLIPPTKDFESFKMLLKDSNFESISNGTNIENLLLEVSIYFNNEENNNLLIISDGSDQDDFSNEINIANQHNVKIHNINIASSKLSPIPFLSSDITAPKYVQNKDGRTVFVTKNNNFNTLSLNTGGTSIEYPFQISDIKNILQKIRNENTEEVSESRRIEYTELFYYPLWLAFFILYIVLFTISSLKNFKIAFMLPFFLYPTHQEASVFDFIHLEEANKSLKNKNYKEAIFNYKKINQTNEVLYNIATLYYKLKDYDKALKTYLMIKTKDRELLFNQYYNMGNCSFQMKKYYQAKGYFTIATKLKKSINAVENLELVTSLLSKEQYKSLKNKNIDRIYLCDVISSTTTTKSTKKAKGKKQKEDISKKKNKEKLFDRKLILEQPKQKNNGSENAVAW